MSTHECVMLTFVVAAWTAFGWIAGNIMAEIRMAKSDRKDGDT